MSTAVPHHIRAGVIDGTRGLGGGGGGESLGYDNNNDDDDNDKQSSGSRLQFTIPSVLYRDEGYAHEEALFGIPKYGGTIAEVGSDVVV